MKIRVSNYGQAFFNDPEFPVETPSRYPIRMLNGYKVYLAASTVSLAPIAKTFLIYSGPSRGLADPLAAAFIIPIPPSPDGDIPHHQ